MKLLRVSTTPRPAVDNSSRGSLVYFAGTAWDGNRGTDQHVAQRLARHLPVLYVDPPSSALRAYRAGGRGALRPHLQQVDEGIVQLAPVVPPAPLRVGMRAATTAALRRTVREALATLQLEAEVLVAAGIYPSLDLLPARLRVLYGTDDFVAGSDLMGMNRDWVQRRERDQLAGADLIVAVSEPLADRWRALGWPTEIVENGCDAEFFAGAVGAPVPDDVFLKPPIAGVVGHLSDRIDMRLLEAVAQRGDSLLLVGPRAQALAGKRFDRLLTHPNVQWVGAKPFAELPAYFGAMSVGLVPYADTPFNRASFPLKTLEYLAAGCAVVATDLPAMHRLPVDVVDVAVAPDDYATAVHGALSAQPDAGVIARRRAVASAHSWDVRARELADLMGLVDGTASVVDGRDATSYRTE